MAAPTDGQNPEPRSNDTPNIKEDAADRRKTKLASALFLGGITVISLSAGFGYTIAAAKKQDPTYFTKGMMSSKVLPESGGALAMRALGLGTLYAVSGVGLLSFAVWKLMGFKSIDDFSAKMRTLTPNPSQDKELGRNDFKTVREVFDYIISEDEKNKGSKT